MKLEVKRNGMRIVPENEQDEAYIRDTLGIAVEGASVPCVMVVPMGMEREIAYLEITKREALTGEEAVESLLEKRR